MFSMFTEGNKKRATVLKGRRYSDAVDFPVKHWWCVDCYFKSRLSFKIMDVSVKRSGFKTVLV